MLDVVARFAIDFILPIAVLVRPVAVTDRSGILIGSACTLSSKASAGMAMAKASSFIVEDPDANYCDLKASVWHLFNSCSGNERAENALLLFPYDLEYHETRTILTPEFFLLLICLPNRTLRSNSHFLIHVTRSECDDDHAPKPLSLRKAAGQDQSSLLTMAERR